VGPLVWRLLWARAPPGTPTAPGPVYWVLPRCSRAEGPENYFAGVGDGFSDERR
jgi:hypothetical protein